MPQLEDRLIRCFASVFPGYTQEEIVEMGENSHGAWDSLSAVTVAAVVQEEFNVEIDPAVLPQLDSFQMYRKYLSRTSSTLE